MLVALTATAVNPAAGEARPRAAAPTLGSVAIRGADLSFTLQEEAAGTVLADGGGDAPIESVLAAAGANYVRLRVWVDPWPGFSSLDSALALAARAKAQGMRVLVDLHYSDVWADPTYQSIPAAWTGQPLRTLADTVRQYTGDVLRAFAAQGTPADMVQIGNEMSNGILWPLGKVQRPDGEHWADLAVLLNAGIAGARAAAPKTEVMLHIESGADKGRSLYVLDQLRSAGVTDFDIIGLSYYAFWQAGLSALGDNMAALAARYNKPVVVAETSYPWTVQGTTNSNWVTNSKQLADGKQYPPTADGQAAYFAALRQTIATVPNGQGLGYFDWEPGWLPGVTDRPVGGSTQWNLAMFDLTGTALPAVRVAFAP
jgi:arabinogalactan endo-1,4-beta-galactosidase